MVVGVLGRRQQRRIATQVERIKDAAEINVEGVITLPGEDAGAIS